MACGDRCRVLGPDHRHGSVDRTPNETKDSGEDVKKRLHKSVSFPEGHVDSLGWFGIG